MPMFTIPKWLSSRLDKLKGPPDPVKGCRVYKEASCSHVDGPLCDYPTCSIQQDYVQENPVIPIARIP